MAVVALDLAETPRAHHSSGRGDEAWEPPPAAPHVDAAEAAALLARALGHRSEVVRVGYGGLDQVDALECDVAVNLCEGIGRDGYPGVEVVEALRARGVPCAGADRDFLLLGLDKALARTRLARHGVRVARGVVVDDGPEGLEALAGLRPPLVIKPREGGGSAGLEVVPTAAGLRAAVEAARATYGALIVEELVDGPELSVPVLGSGDDLRLLPAVEVAFDHGTPAEDRVLRFVDKHDLTDPAAARWWLEQPPRLAERAVAEAVATARAAYEALGGCGHGRVDLRLGPDGPVVLEVNPNPTLEPVLVREEQGLYARSLAAAGMPLVAWLRFLLDDALARASPQLTASMARGGGSGSGRSLGSTAVIARSRREPRGRAE